MNNIYKKNHCQSGTLLTRYVIEQLSFGLKNSDEPLKRYLLSLTPYSAFIKMFPSNHLHVVNI